jgi:hypothetical protein
MGPFKLAQSRRTLRNPLKEGGVSNNNIDFLSRIAEASLGLRREGGRFESEDPLQGTRVQGTRALFTGDDNMEDKR